MNYFVSSSVVHIGYYIARCALFSRKGQCCQACLLAYSSEAASQQRHGSLQNKNQKVKEAEITLGPAR
jgi:hypothetical protein